MAKYYILDEDNIAIPTDLMTWAKMFEDEGNRRVALDTTVKGDTISTVFLGLNHNWGEGEPLLFETMVFVDGNDESEQERCSTWEQAEDMHKRFVDKYK